MKNVSVKQAIDIDATNAFYVTVDGETVTAHTDPHGNGLWIEGKQVEGKSQFSAGRNPASAMRRYFSQ